MDLKNTAFRILEPEGVLPRLSIPDVCREAKREYMRLYMRAYRKKQTAKRKEKRDASRT